MTRNCVRRCPGCTSCREEIPKYCWVGHALDIVRLPSKRLVRKRVYLKLVETKLYRGHELAETLLCLCKLGTWAPPGTDTSHRRGILSRGFPLLTGAQLKPDGSPRDGGAAAPVVGHVCGIPHVRLRLPGLLERHLLHRELQDHPIPHELNDSSTDGTAGVSMKVCRRRLCHRRCSRCPSPKSPCGRGIGLAPPEPPGPTMTAQPQVVHTDTPRITLLSPITSTG